VIYYAACLLEDDGTPITHVDHGGGISEEATSRIAIRVANTYQCHACVINRETGEIVRRIYYRPQALNPIEVDPPVFVPSKHVKTERKSSYPTTERRYLSYVGLDSKAFVEWCTEMLKNGYTLTVTRPAGASPNDGAVNVVASRPVS
jgi:hypothetical protein